MQKIYIIEHVTYSKYTNNDKERVVYSRGNLPQIYTSLKVAVKAFERSVDLYCSQFGYSIKSKDDRILMTDKRVIMATELVDSTGLFRDIITLYKGLTY